MDVPHGTGALTTIDNFDIAARPVTEQVHPRISTVLLVDLLRCFTVPYLVPVLVLRIKKASPKRSPSGSMSDPPSDPSVLSTIILWMR